MTDLTKLTTPFGLLDPETQEALRKYDGIMEIYTGSGWLTCGRSLLVRAETYRARPAPLVPDTIDWSHVAPEWKWMARDEDGEAYLYKTEPEVISSGFYAVGDMATAWDYASCRRGTVAWQDSLVERPE